MRNALSAKRFFETNGKMLVEAACHHVNAGGEKEVAWDLDCYRKVAEAHHLSVSREQLIKALVELSAALTAVAFTE